MADQNICPNCKSPKKESNSGSLTQWIVLCKCEQEPAVRGYVADIGIGNGDYQFHLCRTCGKRIEEGRQGSFTQYIFRSDLCACEKPEPEKVIQSRDFQKVPIQFEDVENEGEIEFNSGAFPSERYKPISILGQGAGGAVYLSRDRLLNKLVAVKLLRFPDERLIVDFQSEARATSSLKHPNIVSVQDFGLTEASVPYMVLEYVPGRSLEQVLAEQKLSPQESIFIILKVCDAISYAHEQGVLHRDIKPGNIILLSESIGDEGVDVRLIDFGIAKTKNNIEIEFPEEKHGEREIAGSPLYMSPDQANGMDYDERSEIYSICCVLFKMVTGEPPYLGENAIGTLRMHLESDVPRLSEFVEYECTELENVLVKGMSKSPRERFQSVGKLKETLAGLILDSERETIDEYAGPVKDIEEKRVMKPVSVLIALASIFLLSFSMLALFRTGEEVENGAESSSSPMQKSRVPEVKESPDSDIGYDKARSVLATIPDKTLDKQFGWGGGKWVFKAPLDRENPVLTGHKVSDEDFKMLVQERKFTNLKLTMESHVTGEGLTYLKGRELKSLWTMSHEFSDVGIHNLLAFPEIKEVIIFYSGNLTLSAYKDLAAMPALKRIQLRGMSRVPEGAMKALSKSRSIDSAVLEMLEPFDGNSLDDFCTLEKLAHLKLRGLKQIDDSCIPMLTKTRLVDLELAMTSVSDKGLLELSKLKTLKFLRVNASSDEEVAQLKKKGKKVKKISFSGITKFCALRPDCKVRLSNDLMGLELLNAAGSEEILK